MKRVALTALFLALPCVAQAAPPVRGYASVPDPPRDRTRTSIIVISPPPTTPGQTIILTPRPGGGSNVTVCSPVIGVGIMCTGPASENR